MTTCETVPLLTFWLGVEVGAVVALLGVLALRVLGRG